MRRIEPIFPSGAPCPGIGLELPARDRIISLASGCPVGVLNCLKPAPGDRKAHNSLKVASLDYREFYWTVAADPGRLSATSLSLISAEYG
jgi:hypothetical protein